MGVRKLKPTTPGQRHKVASDFSEITKSTPEKSLLATKKRSGGRNDTGKMTMRNRGGGHKSQSAASTQGVWTAAVWRHRAEGMAPVDV